MVVNRGPGWLRPAAWSRWQAGDLLQTQLAVDTIWKPPSRGLQRSVSLCKPGGWPMDNRWAAYQAAPYNRRQEVSYLALIGAW